MPIGPGNCGGRLQRRQIKRRGWPCYPGAKRYFDGGFYRTVIYEKNADEARNPASVTKIMTLLLTFDALKAGKIKLTDQVVTSAHAKSYGRFPGILGGGRGSDRRDID